MAFHIKKPSGWTTVSSFHVKKSGGNSGVWTNVAKAFVKKATGWVMFWPTSGPFTITSPYFSTDTAGNTTVSGPTILYGSTIYGQRGTWDPNGGTISSYTYKLESSTSSSIGIGPYESIISETSMGGTYQQLSLNTPSYDGKYLIFTVKATKTDGISGSDSTDSGGTRFIVIRNAPTKSSSQILNSSSPTITTTSLSGGILETYGAPITLSYTNYWNGTEAYLPDSTRSQVKWYYSTVGTYTTPAQVIANATLITSGITTSTPTVSSNIYNVSSSLLLSTITSGRYYYVINTESNSNTDYYGGTGITDSTPAVFGPVNTSPNTVTQPTLTAVTPSGYGGKTNSFTVGATVVGNTGSWTPTPNGPNPVASSFKYSTSSTISNQSGWNQFSVFYDPIYVNQYGFFESYDNQNHSFILGSSIYPPFGGTAISSAGKYLEYVVSVQNGSNSIISNYYTNAQLVYPVPYATGAPVFTYIADNQATVYWAANLYSSYSYRLQYLNGLIWTDLGSMVYTNPTPSTQILYTGLPSDSKSYRVLAYNADGVWISSSTTTYWSAPPSYTYVAGNTMYVGTNGYIAFNTPSSVVNIDGVLGKAFGFAPANAIQGNDDLIQDYLSYASINDAGDWWGILWQGHQYTTGTTANIKVEIWFQASTRDVWAKYTISNLIPSGATSFTSIAGYYYNGVIQGSPVTPTNGLDQYYSMDPESSSVAFLPFAYKGTSWGGWTTLTGISGVTSGNVDDGYYTMTTKSSYAPSAPLNVTANPITISGADISWNEPSDNGGSKIYLYEYSLDNGTWTATGYTSGLPNRFATVSGLLDNTTHTVRVRATNYGYPNSSTSYGSVTFTTKPLYTVTFNSNSPTSGSPSIASIKQTTDGGSVTLATVGTMVKTKFVFGGWNTQANGLGLNYNGGSSYTPTSNVTLYAKWNPVYTVTFNANTGTGSASPTSVEQTTFGGTVTLASVGTLAKSKYVFGGWNTQADGLGTNYVAGLTTYIPTSDVTLYAKWNIVYTVSFSANGGTGSPSISSVEQTTFGGSVTLSTVGTMARSKYVFGGWNTAANGTGTNYSSGSSYTPASDITLYARWLPVYTVSFSVNGGSGSANPTSVEQTSSGGAVTIAAQGTVARTGYTFGGWNTATDGSGTNYAAGTSYTPTSDVTLYAKWTIITYSVTYSANSATSGTAPANQTKTYDVSLTLQTNSGSLARTDYVFDGWNTASDGTGTSYAVSASYTTNAALSLYAKWRRVYTIIFEPDGYLSGSTNTQILSTTAATTRTGFVGDLAAAPSNPTPPTGYTFAGVWRDGTPTNYTNQVNSGASWTITALNKTFYAYYSAIVPNISQVVVAGNVTAGVTCTITGTNMGVSGTLGSIEYTFYARDTSGSAWNQIAAGTAAVTSPTSATISTTGSTGTLPDQYYISMKPFFGPRSGSGSGQGTGTSGTVRSTISYPKSNAAGSLTAPQAPETWT